MTNYSLSYHGNADGFTAALPLSKSESNRLLLIAAVAGISPARLEISECDDTDAMRHGVTAADTYINIGAAGTAMRFLTAYFANTPLPCPITLDGSERMRCRPIAPLVDALRQLGASIEYAGNEGFPPLRITGKRLRGGTIEMDASVSSQYISAIMMIAPSLTEPLEIRFGSRPVSFPYLNMTAAIMRKCGVKAELSEKSVTVYPGSYCTDGFTVEPDWSAASYWYELAALSGRSILIPGLRRDSLQGDSGIASIFRKLGVETEFLDNGVRLTPANARTHEPLNIDLEDMPDVAQTVAVTAALLGKPFAITGLSTLPAKETDRLKALQTELAKLGIPATVTSSSISWDGTATGRPDTIAIDTYRDHRMAMSFAPAAIKYNNLTINDIGVVSKSYPQFWEQLARFGFKYRS